MTNTNPTEKRECIECSQTTAPITVHKEHQDILEAIDEINYGKLLKPLDLSTPTATMKQSKDSFEQFKKNRKDFKQKRREEIHDLEPSTPTVESWEKELEQILIEWEGKDNAILGAVRVLSRTKRLEQFISSQIQQAEERLVERIIKELITIRDTEMEGRKDLMKTRAGYNVNLLIEYLATLKEEKDL